MHFIKNEHQIKFCFTYQYLGKKPPKISLYQEAGLFFFFSPVEYLQAYAFFVLAVGFLEMFFKGIS